MTATTASSAGAGSSSVGLDPLHLLEALADLRIGKGDRARSAVSLGQDVRTAERRFQIRAVADAKAGGGDGRTARESGRGAGGLRQLFEAIEEADALALADLGAEPAAVAGLAPAILHSTAASNARCGRRMA